MTTETNCCSTCEGAGYLEDFGTENPGTNKPLPCPECCPPKKSTPRVAKHRKENRKKGRLRREYYATPPEHDVLKQTLEGLRK